MIGHRGSNGRPSQGGEHPGLRGDIGRQSRLHWLEHPDLVTTEVRLTPTLNTIVAMCR